MDRQLASRLGLAADAGMAGLQHNKRTEELLSLFLHNPSDSLGESLTCIAGETHQDHTCRVGMTGKHQLAKILVLCQEDALLTTGLLDHGTVISMGHNFAHSLDVVAISA